MRQRHFQRLLLLGLGVLGGCAIRAQQLRLQPLNTQRTIEARRQTSASFLLYPFEELRGGEYGLLYPTTFLPGINLFHIGGTSNFPELSGNLRSSQGGRATVTVGSLDSAMPHLLATLMRQMRLTSVATPIEQANTQNELQRYDYVLTGRLHRSRFTYHANIVPLAVLGVLGVPYIFVHFELTFDLSLFHRTNRNTPLLERTYQYSGTRSVGLYYNNSAYYDLFIEALEDTLPRVVSDVADAISAQRASSEAVPAPWSRASPRSRRKPHRVVIIAPRTPVQKTTVCAQVFRW